jgi:hypothetical protein
MGRAKFVHGNATFAAFERVSYTNAPDEVGNDFARIEPDDQFILERSVEELRER